MINVDSYIICGKDFTREIEALESLMNDLMFDIAIESSGVDSNEPDGSRLRSAYKELSDAVQKNDSKKIQEASKEVNSASAEIDEKVKDPEKKKKIIRLAIAAASAAALTVGAIVVANDLKKGDSSKLRGALDVAKKAVVKIGSSVKRKFSSAPNVIKASTVSFDSIKNYAKSNLNTNPDKEVGISILSKDDLKKYGLNTNKKYLAKALFTTDGEPVESSIEIIQYESLEPKLQSFLDSHDGTVVLKK